MAITLVGQQTNTGTNTGTLTAIAPTGMVADDVMFVHIGTAGGAGQAPDPNNLPTGWTHLPCTTHSAIGQLLAWKLYEAGDNGASFNFSTASTNTNAYSAVITALKNVDTTTIEVDSQFTQATANANFPSITSSFTGAPSWGALCGSVGDNGDNLSTYPAAYPDAQLNFVGGSPSTGNSSQNAVAADLTSSSEVFPAGTFVWGSNDQRINSIICFGEFGGVFPPGPPQNLTVQAGTAGGSADLDWDVPSTGDTPENYQVYRADEITPVAGILYLYGEWKANISSATATFTDVPVGAPKPSRKILVAASAQFSRAQQITSGTLDTVPHIDRAIPGTNYSTNIGFFLFEQGENSTATITVTAGGTLNNCAIHVYELVSYDTLEGEDFDLTLQSQRTTFDLSVPHTDDAAIITLSHSTAAGTISVIGANLDTTLSGTSNQRVSGAQNEVTGNSTQAITWNHTASSIFVGGGVSLTASMPPGPQPGPYEQVGTTVHPDTDYTDTGLTGGNTYYYKVTASNAGGVSDDSNVVSFTATGGAGPANIYFGSTLLGAVKLGPNDVSKVMYGAIQIWPE